VSKPKPTLEDLIGIEYVKLGFFREARETIDELRVSNQELAQKKLQIQAILNGITECHCGAFARLDNPVGESCLP